MRVPHRENCILLHVIPRDVIILSVVQKECVTRCNSPGTENSRQDTQIRFPAASNKCVETSFTGITSHTIVTSPLRYILTFQLNWHSKDAKPCFSQIGYQVQKKRRNGRLQPTYRTSVKVRGHSERQKESSKFVFRIACRSR